MYTRCVTWSRDSHGLFDYESRYINKKNIKTSSGGKIIRLNNDVEFISPDLHAEDIDRSAKPLVSIRQKANGRSMILSVTQYGVGKFVITNDTGSALSKDSKRDENGQLVDGSNMMFVVVRNLKSQ